MLGCKPDEFGGVTTQWDRRRLQTGNRLRAVYAIAYFRTKCRAMYALAYTGPNAKGDGKFDGFYDNPRLGSV